MKLTILFLSLVISFSAFSSIKVAGGEISILSRGIKLLGKFPNRSVEDRSVGVACSRLHGFTNSETNEITAACKVCYSDRYNDSNWSKVEPLTEGDIYTVAGIEIGGDSNISENYSKGYNFIMIARSEKSNKGLRIICTGSKDLERADLNEIFKGALDFKNDMFDRD